MVLRLAALAAPFLGSNAGNSEKGLDEINAGHPQDNSEARLFIREYVRSVAKCLLLAIAVAVGSSGTSSDASSHPAQ
jgi:hypothetical protein